MFVCVCVYVYINFLKVNKFRNCLQKYTQHILTSESKIQQNSINPACRCRKGPRLFDRMYSDLTSYRYFLLLVPYLVYDNGAYSVHWYCDIHMNAWNVCIYVCMYEIYSGSTTNLRTIPLGYNLHLMVQCHKGPLLCFLESSQWRSWWRRQGDSR